MAEVAKLQVVIDAVDNASKTLEGIGSQAQSLGKGFAVAGGVITGALALAVKSAGDAQMQFAQMTAITDNLGNVASKAGIDLEELQGWFNDVGKSAIQLGFDNTEVSLSMARLAQTTGDVSIAQEGVGLAMDLARARGISLEQSTMAINLALQGSPKLLRQYGIELDDTAGKTEILSALNERFGGTAEKMTDTINVQMEVLRVQFGNVMQEIGNQLIPVLTDLLQNHILPIIEKVQAWAKEHPELFKNLVLVVGAIGLLMVALAPVLIALPMIASGIAIFGVVLGAVLSPIGLFIIAVLAIVAGLVWLWFNVDTVTQKINQAWQWVVNQFTDFKNQLMDGFKELVDRIVNNWTEFWAQFKALLEAGFKWIGDQWKILTDGLSAIWEGLKAVTISVFDFIMGKVQSVVDNIMGVVNRAIEAWNKMKSLVTQGVQASVGFVQNVGKRIGFADGGIVTRPTNALIGEAGAEAVIPLSKLSGGFGANITVNVSGNTILGGQMDMLANQVGDAIINRLGMQMRI